MVRVSDHLIVSVTPDRLSVDAALAAVADPGAGGTCVFVGTVRDTSDESDVTGRTRRGGYLGVWRRWACQRSDE